MKADPVIADALHLFESQTGTPEKRMLKAILLAGKKHGQLPKCFRDFLFDRFDCVAVIDGVRCIGWTL